MSKSTVTKFKWFWADQDLEQEAWLREMARQGLHLSSVIGMVWTFAKGEPQNVAYRIDYSSKGRDSDYNQLLEDAGWECAATSAGWHYWRKTVAPGEAPELFTESGSKIDRFRTVLAVLILLTMPSVILLPKAMAQRPGYLPLVMGAFLALMVYSSIRLLLRIGRLHKAD